MEQDQQQQKQPKYSEKQIENYIYRFTDSLGHGTFGTVYKGRNKNTDELVAIKVIDKNQVNLKDPFLAESLKKEIKIMESLKSPHLVKMYDVFGTSNNIYLMLEYCNGGDLRNLLKQNKGYLNEDLAIEILVQLMDGLKELVDNGYIHRDIKPENSLIHNGQYKVADFGFATKVDIRGRQLMKEFVGSPLYMSPQILQQQSYSAKSDIWSIGMMFYEMLFGKAPWNCRDINSLLKGITTTPLRFPYDKPVSSNTKHFIRQCLQVEENTRIGWDEIFKHPLYQQSKSNQGSNQEYKRGWTVEGPAKQLDEKSKRALKKVQDIVSHYKIDIQDIFQHFDTDKGGFLDQQEFSSFLNKIDPTMNESEAINVFQKVDQSQDGQISFEEFSNLFNEYDFSELGDMASNLINELREIIQTYKLNLSDIFRNFDKDQQGTLDIKEFEQLLRIIAPGLKEEDVKAVFKKFDMDGNGEITFDEFQQIIYKPNNNGNNNNNNRTSSKKHSMTQQEKARNILAQLKTIVKNKNLDIQKIFNNFDTSKDNSLQFEEIRKMMMVFDKRIQDEEVKMVIRYLDKDGDQEISFEEFSKALQ